jgi:hypothetical protein
MTDWIKLPHPMNGPSVPVRSNNPERKEGQSVQSWKRECWRDVLNESFSKIEDVNVRNAIFALVQLGAVGSK